MSFTANNIRSPAAHVFGYLPQNEASHETQNLIEQCLTDIGAATLEGLFDPEAQLAAAGYAAAQAIAETNIEAHIASQGRPSATFGRNATIVPGAAKPLTFGQIAGKGLKRFVPGYAIANIVVALGSGGAGAVNSKACNSLVSN